MTPFLLVASTSSRSPCLINLFQVITVGLNAIREVIAHCPVVLEEDGMQVCTWLSGCPCAY